MRCLHRLRCSVRGFARSAHPPPRHDETTSSRWAPLLRIESREGRRHRLAIASQFFGRRGRRLPPIHSNRPPPLNLFREGGPRPHPSSSPAVGTPAHPHSVQANRSNEPLARSWRQCLRLSMPPQRTRRPSAAPRRPHGVTMPSLHALPTQAATRADPTTFGTSCAFAPPLGRLRVTPLNCKMRRRTHKPLQAAAATDDDTHYAGRRSRFHETRNHLPTPPPSHPHPTRPQGSSDRV